jgi:hypothetical protein
VGPVVEDSGCGVLVLDSLGAVPEESGVIVSSGPLGSFDPELAPESIVVPHAVSVSPVSAHGNGSASWAHAVASAPPRIDRTIVSRTERRRYHDSSGAISPRGRACTARRPRSARSCGTC